MDSLYIIGFPSLYGGAGAELYHQIKVWRHMCVDIHLIPTQKNVHRAELYPEMVGQGVTVHEGYDWSAIPEGAPLSVFAMKSSWLRCRRYGNGQERQCLSIA